MTDQMDFFGDGPTEEWVYRLLLPALSATLDRNNAGRENICADAGKSYTSVSFLTHEIVNVDANGNVKEETNKHLAFRICSRGKNHYFGIPVDLLALAPDTIHSRAVIRKSDPTFARCTFEPTSDGALEYTEFLCQALESVVDAIPKEFDCCSRVEVCSDAKHCINPNPSLAVSCGYRKILKSGRIFYGKNRNVE